MAYIKQGTHFDEVPHKDAGEFDKIYGPEEDVFYTGIYYCINCNKEIIRPKNSKFPSHNIKKDDHRHKWQLLVSLIKPFVVLSCYE